MKPADKIKHFVLIIVALYVVAVYILCASPQSTATQNGKRGVGETIILSITSLLIFLFLFLYNYEVDDGLLFNAYATKHT